MSRPFRPWRQILAMFFDALIFLGIVLATTVLAGVVLKLVSKVFLVGWRLIP